MNDAQRDALRAAMQLGYPGFPCLADKRPACPRGFKDACLPVAGLAGLWATYPGELVGVPTGSGSGLAVLDIDPRNGGAKWYSANKLRLPATRIHRTRSGGLHLLFHHRPGLKCSASRVAPGVDVRADGGYIIWWPAERLEVRDAPLANWPEWLTPTPVAPPEAKSSAEIIQFAPRLILESVKGVLQKVALAGEGERNALLFWGACKFRDMAAEGKITLQTGYALLAEAAMRTGLGQVEVERTIASAQRSEARHG